MVVDREVPNSRIFEALGSNSCSQFFLLLPKQLNGLKSRIWQTWLGRDGYGKNVISDWVNAAKMQGNPKPMLEAFRNVSCDGTLKVVLC